jgi:pantothenate kinase type III
MLNNVWNWQQDFLAKNSIAIGYNAWMGYQSGHRGVLICTTNNPTVGVTGETFPSYFVPRPRLAPFLNAWLDLPHTDLSQYGFTSDRILAAVDTYNPEKDAILFLESGHQVTFFYLNNLPTPPPICYERICQEWEEFHRHPSL